MAGTPLFYPLWLMFPCVVFAGLMAVGVTAKVGSEQLSAAEHAELVSSHLATGFTLVVALAIGNGIGRPVIGLVSDRIGRGRRCSWPRTCSSPCCCRGRTR